MFIGEEEMSTTEKFSTFLEEDKSYKILFYFVRFNG